jgi:hypothetical protein
MIGVLAALLLVGGSGVGGQAPQELSNDQIALLANEIVSHTPEHIHFESDAIFTWVLFTQRDHDGIPGLTQAVRIGLQTRYTVYRTKEEVPSDRLHLDMNGDVIGYREGFAFGFVATVVGEGQVEGRYSDWEGNVAASSQSIWYKWKGTRWEVSKRGPLIVA